MKVIQIALKPGDTPYDIAKQGRPQQFIPGSFRAIGSQFVAQLLVDASPLDPNDPVPAPCMFHVVGMNAEVSGGYLGTASGKFLFSDCFSSI